MRNSSLTLLINEPLEKNLKGRTTVCTKENSTRDTKGVQEGSPSKFIFCGVIGVPWVFLSSHAPSLNSLSSFFGSFRFVLSRDSCSCSVCLCFKIGETRYVTFKVSKDRNFKGEQEHWGKISIPSTRTIYTHISLWTPNHIRRGFC